MPVVVAPRGIEDLTAEWLTAALYDASGGSEVAELLSIRIGHGNVADSVRLIPRWSRPTEGFDSLVAKVPASSEMSRSAGFTTRTYEVEAAFYRELADTVWVHRPLCHLAMFEPDHEAYAVLLQDLAPAEPGDQISGCDVAEAMGAVAELAALHAPRFGDESLMAIPWLDHPDSEGGTRTAALVSSLFEGFIPRFGSELDPDVLVLSHRLMANLEPYLLNRPGPWSVLHGDFRVDNLLFGGPRVAVLDWQTVKVGPPMADVAYFIGSALQPPERRLHEQDLVRSYHGLMGAAGVDMTWEDCWRDYCRYAFDGLVMAIAASMLVTQTDRSDEMFTVMANRHGRQALDLDSADLLDI